MPRLVLPQLACDRVLFRWRPWMLAGSSRRATARDVGATASASLPPPTAPFNPRHLTAPRSTRKVGRGAACESPRTAIHPEIPRCGIEGPRPSLPQRQPRRGVALVFLCALCFSAVAAVAFSDLSPLFLCALCVKSFDSSFPHQAKLPRTTFRVLSYWPELGRAAYRRPHSPPAY